MEEILVPNRSTRDLPLLLQKVRRVANIWIVGSTARDGLAKGRDIDVLVPLQDWYKVAPLLVLSTDDHAVTNTAFGGWRVRSQGYQIDLWPDELGRFLTDHEFKAAWNVATGVVIQRVE